MEKSPSPASVHSLPQFLASLQTVRPPSLQENPPCLISFERDFSPALLFQRPLPTFWWDLSGRGIKIKTPDMKEDIGLEAFSIAVAIGFLDQASDSIVKTFEGGVGDSVGKVG